MKFKPIIEMLTVEYDIRISDPLFTGKHKKKIRLHIKRKKITALRLHYFKYNEVKIHYCEVYCRI